jgi:hypothetical protein
MGQKCAVQHMKGRSRTSVSGFLQYVGSKMDSAELADLTKLVTMALMPSNLRTSDQQGHTFCTLGSLRHI